MLGCGFPPTSVDSESHSVVRSFVTYTYNHSLAARGTAKSWSSDVYSAKLCYNLRPVDHSRCAVHGSVSRSNPEPGRACIFAVAYDLSRVCVTSAPSLPLFSCSLVESCTATLHTFLPPFTSGSLWLHIRYCIQAWGYSTTQMS
jgi:hypothetical protein